MLSLSTPHLRRIRSFVCRNSRETAAQARAYQIMWPQIGLQIENGLLDYRQVFLRDAPRFLEVGFGSGQSLHALAKANPDKDYIGIEMHKPGVGTLLMNIQQDALTNIRIYHADAVDVLDQCISVNSLDGIQLFFPDPWQKRRHHERRLIQSAFVARLVEKLKIDGRLHLATDWDDYAKHMMQVISHEERLINLAGPQQFSQRSPQRPIETKFERRALRDGRAIYEIQAARISGLDNNSGLS